MTKRHLLIASLRPASVRANTRFSRSLYLPVTAATFLAVWGDGSFAATPIAAYGFNESNGTIAADQSGNNRAGTLINGPLWAPGKNGGGVRFDGANDRVSFGDYSAADGQTSFTVSAWVKFSVSGGGGGETHLIDKSVCNGYTNSGPWELGVSLTRSHRAEFLIYPENGSPAAYIFSGASSTSVDDGAWHYITGRYDGSHLSIWVDGVQENSVAAPGVRMSSTSNNVEAGGHCNGWSYPFSGTLDDVRVYNTALTASEINADMGTPVGGAPPASPPPPPDVGTTTPVLSFGFEDAAGTATADQSGAGNHGTLMNGAAWSVGRHAGGLRFDGVNDYVTVANAPSLNVSGNRLSLSAWVYPTTATGTRVIVGKPYSATAHSGPAFSYAMYAIDTNRVTFHVRTGSATQRLNSTRTLPVNTWSHVAGVYDGATMKIYIDGVDDASQSATGTVVPYATPLRVGANGALAHVWQGSLDNIRLGGHANSAAQVQSEMNTAVGGSAQNPPPPPPTDVTAPSVPTGLTASGVTSSQATLSWQASTDNVAVAGYRVFRDSVLVGTTSATSHTVTSLSANTTHSFTVSAFDAAGNNSAQSAARSVTTSASSGATYSTNFDLNENPISEGGVWRRAPNQWTNVQTVGGVAFGTNGITNGYDDSYALLSGFGPNQTASAVVFADPTLSPGPAHEVELLLRFSDDANNARGYECLFNMDGHVQLVRWKGVQGDVEFIVLSEWRSLGRRLVTGDTVKASIIGNEIRLYINDMLMGRAVDSAVQTGQPGISFFIRPGGSQRYLGLTSYTVTSQ
jgi:chitodextrinase